MEDHTFPHLGNEHDYLTVSIRGGGVALSVQLGSGELDTDIRPPGGVRFDDNAWHHVRVRRKAEEVSTGWWFCLTSFFLLFTLVCVA